jgi:hypothetical protein
MTIGTPLALVFLNESASAAQSLARPSPPAPSLESLCSFRTIQHGREALATRTAWVHGFKYDEDEEGGKSVTDVTLIPAASAAAAAIVVFPQLPSLPFGLEMQRRT